MKRTIQFKLMFLVAHLVAATVFAYTPEEGSEAEKTTAEGRWITHPSADLPNVLILGDSVSIGYTLQVKELLKGQANVFRPHSPDGTRPINCQGTTFGIGNIDSWLAGRKWDVILFNFGLHDLKHVDAETGINSANAADPRQASVEKYAENLEVIVEKLETTGARLIFATTTPVPPGVNNPLREPDAPVRYNAVALKIMNAHRIQVNDLFSLCQKQLEDLQHPANVHFNSAGNRVLAEQVAEAIQSALNMDDN